MLRTFQFGASASGTESLFGEAAERRAEVDQGRLVQVEDVGVQVEAVADGHREAIQVGHAKHEGPGPVGQAAGGGSQGPAGFEEAGVDLRGHGIAEDCAKSAAHHVGALASRKMNLVQGAEMKAEAVELECSHNVAGGPNKLLLYNGKAFDSCFPLRTKFERGLRESIPQPLFCCRAQLFVAGAAGVQCG